jgi:uncharacterized membrane protein YbhN (UPF0104 family)
VDNWQAVSTYDWIINPYMVSLSFVLHILAYIFFSKTWCILMESFGFSIKLRQGFKIAYLTNLGRYLPGKIWPVFGMIYLLNRIGIKKEVAIASWGIATILGLPPAFLLASITIYAYPEIISEVTGGPSPAPAMLIVFFGLLSLVLIWFPQKAIAFYNYVIIKLKKTPLEFSISKAAAGKVYLGYFFTWCLYGLAFYSFAKGISDHVDIPITAATGSFVLAYILGYLAVFSPGGLGARELVLTGVLTPFFGPLAAGIALAARVWNMLNEIIAAAVAWFLRLE